MKFLRLMVFAMLTILVAGCSGGSSKAGEFEPDTFSVSDMCIMRVDDESVKVCYGDSKKNAEKVLGQGIENKLKGFDYDFGVEIRYRDESVASISIKEGAYKTARGAEIGMSKEDAKKLYGAKYSLAPAQYNLDYFYDSKEKKFLGKVSLDAIKVSDAATTTFVLSLIYDDDGVRKIMLLDHKMAMTLS